MCENKRRHPPRRQCYKDKLSADDAEYEAISAMNVTILSTILMQLHSLPPTGLPPLNPISPTRALMGSLVPYQGHPFGTNHSTVTASTSVKQTTISTTMLDTTTLSISPEREQDSREILESDTGGPGSGNNEGLHTSSQVDTYVQSNTTLHTDSSGDSGPTAEPEHHADHAHAEHPVPPSYGHEHRPHKIPPTSDREAGPYFRPPGAISKKHRTRNNKNDFDPNCFPRCWNYTNSRTSGGSSRRRKHSQKEKNFYNYKLLYDTIKDSERRKETEFYAWIFGAVMLGLGSLTTLTSCFAFCFCSERWRKRKKTKKLDQSGDYQRVDSVSSMVSHADSSHADYEPLEPIDDVTII